MAGKKAAPEVHKFGGASLGDAEAFRHAVGIMQKRTAPRAIVVSALAGITDALLGLANRATAGGDAHLGRDAQTLRTRYRAILDAVCPAGDAGTRPGGTTVAPVPMSTSTWPAASVVSDFAVVPK